MFKLYNIVCAAVFSKLRLSQIPVGPARTRWGRCHSPCSGRILSQRLRALAGPGGCHGPGCSVQRYVGFGLPSPVPSRAVVASLLWLQAPGRGASTSVHMHQRRRSAGLKVHGHDGALPVVRLVVARPMVRVWLVARPVYN
jgi:hypothetical protein